jgi:hypothetical protein
MLVLSAAGRWPTTMPAPPSWSTGTAVAAAARLRCGAERWAVKTLTDAAARRVNLKPIRSTIDTLRGLSVPGLVEFSTPRFQAEMRTYQVDARLLWVKEEEDRDFHLVVAGASGATMIAEIPDPDCAEASPYVTTLRTVRNAFVSRFGRPDTRRFYAVSGEPAVAITGVLFFDSIHGQRGVAPNGVELHPVLDLK